MISDSFAADLRRKGVSEGKLTRIYNPATHRMLEDPRPAEADDGVTAMTMGNVGHTQNLAALTRAFESSGDLARLGARFVIAGDGVAGEDVREAITTDRVRSAVSIASRSTASSTAPPSPSSASATKARSTSPRS